MALLALEHVSRSRLDGRTERLVLDDVSLELRAGELACVWGTRGSGRTALLRVAAGIDRPDAGSVRFDGVDLARADAAQLDGQIGWVMAPIAGPRGEPLVEQLAIAPIARGASRERARVQVLGALERAGADHCRELRIGQLDAEESVRAAIAQALVLEPRLLLVDEPTAAVRLSARDRVLALLRTIADAGTAVLMTAGDAIGLSGVDRALTISGGRLRTEVVPRCAEVIPLAPRTRRRAVIGQPPATSRP